MASGKEIGVEGDLRAFSPASDLPQGQWCPGRGVRAPRDTHRGFRWDQHLREGRKIRRMEGIQGSLLIMQTKKGWKGRPLFRNDGARRGDATKGKNGG